MPADSVSIVTESRAREGGTPIKRVYSSPNSIAVAQVRSALEMAGIQCTLRNEYAGGASGELAPLETWPEIWVLRDQDHDRALAIIEQFLADVDEADWVCAGCHRSSPATFDFCWHCGRDR